jgi:hypothetical protein
MKPVVAAVVQVFTDRPPQITLTQCDHMVEKLPAATAHSARHLHAGAFRVSPVDFTNRITSAFEYGVAVENHVAIRASPGKSLAEPLEDPLGCRFRRHIEVQDATAAVLDDEEALQQVKTSASER